MNKAAPWVNDGWPKLVRDFKGLRARTVREFHSGMYRVPPGTMVTIGTCNRARNIHIETDACSSCGISVYMTRLHWRDLELQ